MVQVLEVGEVFVVPAELGARDHARGIVLRLLCTVEVKFGNVTGKKRDGLAVGRPSGRSDTLLEPGERARLAAGERQHVVLRLRPLGAADERERAAVGRPAWLGGAAVESQSSRRL